MIFYQMYSQTTRKAVLSQTKTLIFPLISHNCCESVLIKLFLTADNVGEHREWMFSRNIEHEHFVTQQLIYTHL